MKVSFAELVGGAPFLVLAPHPDDEALGCGGLLSAAAASGHPAAIAWLTDGARSHPNSRAWPPARLAARRRAEAEAAAGVLGVAPARRLFLDAPDGAAPHAGAAFDELAARLEAFAADHAIGTVFATWIGDPHGDHGAAAKLAAAVCARGGLRHVAYPVWAWTAPKRDWPPALRLDVAAHLARKRQALAAHASQLPGGIVDDPEGFAMSDEFLKYFLRGEEVFFVLF